MKHFLMILAVALGLAACKHYQTIPVTLPDGFVVQAWVADTPAKQEKGLMYVKHLPEDKGMIFVFEQDQPQVFWMKNTLIDLDIIFLTSDKRVSGVAAQVPHSYTYTPDEDVAYVPGFGKYVLELASTTAAKHGVQTGSRLSFETYAP